MYLCAVQSLLLLEIETGFVRMKQHSACDRSFGRSHVFPKGSAMELILRSLSLQH